LPRPMIRCIVYENPKSEYLNPKQIQNYNSQMFKTIKFFSFDNLNFGHLILFRASYFEFRIYFLIIKYFLR